MKHSLNAVCLSAITWALVTIGAMPAVALTMDFEGLANGRHLDTPFEVSPLFNITASETHSPGPAIFDSTPSGPNAGGLDPDLLIDNLNLIPEPATGWLLLSAAAGMGLLRGRRISRR